MGTFIRIFFLGLFIFLLANGKAMLWFALIAGGLLLALIFGRVYCAYVCPMNTLMIPAELLSKKLGIQAESKPKWLKNGYFTWIALLLSIAAMLLLRKMLHFELPILPLWVIISVIVTLRFKPAVFHNLICPFTGLFRSFGQFGRLSKRVDPDTCIGCKLCENVCPSDAITVFTDDKKAAIDIALCHQCTNCAEVCPKSSIYYGK